jgi:hypothetical protein
MTNGKTVQSVASNLPLRRQVDALEQQLYARRGSVGTRVHGIGEKLRARMTAPSTLLIAVAVGVAIDQGTRKRGWTLVQALEGLNLANSLIVTLTSVVRSLDAPQK